MAVKIRISDAPHPPTPCFGTRLNVKKYVVLIFQQVFSSSPFLNKTAWVRFSTHAVFEIKEMFLSSFVTNTVLHHMLIWVIPKFTIAVV